VQPTENKQLSFFVDESGDPAFYGKGGRIIVGEEGCSRILILGFVQTDNPQPIRDRLLQIRQAIAADKYLQNIPSLRKTLLHFHAKDDCAEVRMLVFKALAEMDFSVQVVVARKIESMFRTRYQGSQDRFYDDLVSRLFQNVLHKAEHNTITFSRRGKKSRQHAMRTAIERGTKLFRQKWQTNTETNTEIFTKQPSEDPLLDVIDYANWTVHRAYERGEMRHFDFLRDKFALVCDVFDSAHYAGGVNFYNRTTNPFDIKKVSPLG